MTDQQTAYVVTSGSYSDYTVERVYLDHDEAHRFVDAYNAASPYGEMCVDEFPIGAPRVDYDGLIWVGTWRMRRRLKGERQVIITAPGITTIVPNAVPTSNGGFYAYREAFAPAEYADPPQWDEGFHYKQEWHTGETPPRAKITERRPEGNDPWVVVRGTSREHVEKSLQDAAAQVKAERAGIA